MVLTRSKTIALFCALGILSNRARGDEESPESSKKTPVDQPAGAGAEPAAPTEPTESPAPSEAPSSPAPQKAKRAAKKKKKRKKGKTEGKEVLPDAESKGARKEVDTDESGNVKSNRGMESVHLSAAAGLQLTSAKGLLFNQSDAMKATGSRWELGIRVFPFTRLGQSVLYRSIGFVGHYAKAQTFTADVKDESNSTKVGSYKLDLQERSVGLALRMGFSGNKFILNGEFLPYCTIAQNPVISGPLSKAAVIDYQAKGLGTLAGVEYFPSENFSLNVNALFASALQGKSTNVSIDELTSTKVTLQKASYFRFSEQTKYYFSHVFFYIDLSFSSFDVTIPHDDVPSRSISQRNTAALFGLGATF